MKTKSQAAFEFLLLAGFMMFIFVVFFAIAGEKLIEMNEARREKVAQDIIDSVMAEFELAHESMDGYTRNFILPENVEGEEYEIGIHNVGEGKDLLILLYMDKIYNYEMPFKIMPGSRLYKGSNVVQKSENGIFVVSEDDPCNDVVNTPGDKSYCLGGYCYCYLNYYVYGEGPFGNSDNFCDNEDDSTLPEGMCDIGCVEIDWCNPPPGINPGDQGDVTVSEGNPSDTTAILHFTTNESVTVLVKYGEPAAGCSWGELNQEKYYDNAKESFDIVIDNMHAMTEYCFAIEVTDQKGASQIYEGTDIISPNTFTTTGDVSAPLVRYAYLYPVLDTPLDTHEYDGIIELIVNVTDDSFIPPLYDPYPEIIATIKQEEEDETYTPVLTLDDFEDTADYASCGINPLSLGNLYHDSGYIQCFPIDNEFARYASYSLDIDTLFYAPYDTTFDSDSTELHAAAGTVTTTDNIFGTDIVSARFGNGIEIDSSEKLSYSAINNFDNEKGTIEFWFKPIAGTGLRYFFYLDGEQGVVLSLYMESDDSFTFSIAGTTVNSGTLALLSSQWYFIAITWDYPNPDNGEMHMYFNGEEVGDGQIDVIDFPIDFINSYFYVGSYPSGLSGVVNANAIIDQFRILDKAKSPDDIKDYDYDITRNYVIYFETKDILGNEDGTIEPGDYLGTSSFSVNYGT